MQLFTNDPERSQYSSNISWGDKYALEQQGMESVKAAAGTPPEPCNGEQVRGMPKIEEGFTYLARTQVTWSREKQMDYHQ